MYTWQSFQNSVHVQVCLQILLQPLIIIISLNSFPPMEANSIPKKNPWK